MHLNRFLKYICFAFFLIILGCNETLEIAENIPEDNIVENTSFKILSLGDSYTIGTSVCDKCRFPEQLLDSLLANNDASLSFSLKVIATNGWTTTNLINALRSENVDKDYNLVTLLIGVNNQYQNKEFAIYEKEFPELVNFAINSVSGNAKQLIVLSIPDYAYTPFGNGSETISAGIKKYNDFAQAYCLNNNITFLNITDITQLGLANPIYVASDGLHPSKEAYSAFVERLLPIATEKLGL